MPLEAVMVLMDNSESSRNGDYPPTRFEAQADAVNMIFQSVTAGNPESEVGLMSIAGKGPQVLTTLTTDRGKILFELHRTKKIIGGSSQLWTGLQVAFLGLKHRKNRSQRQRIIAFVCSPPDKEEMRKLEDLSFKFIKNNVTVDFVLFGDLDDDTKNTLEKFIDMVKGDRLEGAQLVVIPPSGKLLSDQLLASPILLGEGAAAVAAAAAANAGGGDFGEFGFDPSLEPELALALRMSMEEEKARQEKRAQEEEEAATKASLESVSEEIESAQPLLNHNGEPSNSEQSNDQHDKGEHPDKMDTS